MKNTKKYLAVDLGGSSGRGIIGNFDGEKFTLEEVHRFSNDPVISGGVMCWDSLRLFFEIKNALASSAKDGGIESLAIDTWGVDYGYIDKNGALMTNPCHYRDSRTAGMEEHISKSISRERLYEITGIMPQSINTIFQLASDRLVRPWLPDNAGAALMTPDLFSYLLSGEIGCEYTIASTGGFLDAKARAVSAEALAAAGISPDLFGKISLPGDIRGTVLPEIAKETGLGKVNVVCAPSHDTASAVLAVPCPEDDYLFLSSGTWSIMGVETPDPVIKPEGLAGGFSNEGGAFGRITLIRNIMGLWLEQESRRQWRREGEEVSFNDLSIAASEAEPLRSIIVPDDPMFSPAGDMPGRIAEYCKKTGQPVPETKGQIVRCIFDSLALCYRHTAEKLESLCGRKYDKIYIVGGGTKEELLSRLTADCTGKVVVAGPAEATALGNIAVQALAAGEFANRGELRAALATASETKVYEPSGNSAAWDEAYARYLKLAGN